MKYILLITFVLGASSLKSKCLKKQIQLSEIESTIKIEPSSDILVNGFTDQQKEINKLSLRTRQISLHLTNLKYDIDSLKLRTDSNRSNLAKIAKGLETKIHNAEKQTISQIEGIDSDVEKNRLYWIIATLLILLLGIVMYLFLGRQIKSSQSDLEKEIRTTKKSLEEESLKLDAQLLGIINSQLRIKEAETEQSESGEKDHSLVLKVADEVTRILMNLEVMDKEIKGYKHLKKYSESILDNLKAYGYEIPQLIGMNYNSGMNMVATLEFDETVESGKQIIKRIIKPQVNFEGKMIQAAKVTVAFNE